MKKLLIILISLVNIAYAADKIGVVSSVSGIVSATAIDGSRNNLNVGSDIFLKDTIITQDNSLVTLSFKNGSNLELSGNTELALSEYSLTNEPNALFEQIKGKIYFEVSKFFSVKSNSYRVKTKTAVLGVKGTEFTTVANDTQTDLIVHSGSVAFNNVLEGLGNGVVIDGGFASRIIADNKPIKPVENNKFESLKIEKKKERQGKQSSKKLSKKQKQILTESGYSASELITQDDGVKVGLSAYQQDNQTINQQDNQTTVSQNVDIVDDTTDVNDDSKEDIEDYVIRPFFGTVSYMSNTIGTNTYGSNPIPLTAASGSNTFTSSSTNAILEKNTFAKDDSTGVKLKVGDGGDYIYQKISTGSSKNSEFFDGYEYVAWGSWDSSYTGSGSNTYYGYTGVEGTRTFGVVANSGYWVLGQEAYDVPTTGSAQYNGELKGKWIDYTDTTILKNMTGDVNFGVDFSANTISGSGDIKVNGSKVNTWTMDPLGFNTNMVDRNGTPFKAGDVNTDYWFVSENEFAGTNNASAGDTSNGDHVELFGALNGKGGSEISGSLNYRNNNGTGSGVFRAKKQ